MKNANQKNL